MAGFVQLNMLFTLLLCFLVLLVQEKVHDRVLRGVCHCPADLRLSFL